MGITDHQSGQVPKPSQSQRGHGHRSRLWRALAGIAGVIVAGLLIRAQTPSSPQAPKPPSLPTPAPAAPLYPEWKSQTTGNEYRVRVQGDSFYAEWTNLSPDFASHGAYVRTECRRVGSKWIGTTRSRLPCTGGPGPKPKVLNWCPLVTRTEIDSIAPDRITGRGQAIRRSDCQSCKLLETEWKDFVWTPKTRAGSSPLPDASGKAPAR